MEIALEFETIIKQIEKEQSLLSRLNQTKHI